MATDDLRAVLSRISSVLGATPEQHRQFETWALERLRLLVNAERDGRQTLLWQALQFRQEYLELQHDLAAGISATGRTELLRSARKEWLAAVLEFVDGLIEDRRAA
jgi:hypothetical protein